MESELPRENDMYRYPQMLLLIRAAAVMGVVLAVIALLGFTVWGWEKRTCQTWYAVWALLPPTYFVLEMAYLYNWEYQKFEQFKHLKDLQRAFWGAVLVVLGVAYLGRFGLQIPSALPGG